MFHPTIGPLSFEAILSSEKTLIILSLELCCRRHNKRHKRLSNQQISLFKTLFANKYRNVFLFFGFPEVGPHMRIWSPCLDPEGVSLSAIVSEIYRSILNSLLLNT